MTALTETRPVLALDREHAAQALGIGVDAFDAYVRDHLPVVYIGRKRVWSVSELQRWLDRAATGGVR